MAAVIYTVKTYHENWRRSNDIGKHYCEFCKVGGVKRLALYWTQAVDTSDPEARPGSKCVNHCQAHRTQGRNEARAQARERGLKVGK